MNTHNTLDEFREYLEEYHHITIHVLLKIHFFELFEQLLFPVYWYTGNKSCSNNSVQKLPAGSEHWIMNKVQYERCLNTITTDSTLVCDWSSNKNTFHQDFLVIPRHSLRNYNNLERMFSRYYMRCDVLRMFQSLITY